MEATQERDGHAGAVVRLYDAAERVIAAAVEREKFADRLARRHAVSARARIRTDDASSSRWAFPVRAAPGEPGVAVVVLPDLEAAPVHLSDEAARELIVAMTAARRKLSERRARPGAR